MSNSRSLASRLGHKDDARLVIISCDDLGSCHGATEGVYQAIRDGVATCASIMVPAPWARYAADQYKGEDIGVHLTLMLNTRYTDGAHLLMRLRCCQAKVAFHVQ
jgi:predicted glycoside hydrolase/deacetylase ChbG (UPF0249 family)